MRSRLSALAIALGVLGVGSLLIAQSGQQPIAKTSVTPDLTGVWYRFDTSKDPDGFSTWTITKEDLPMLPWAAEQYKAVRSGPLRSEWDKGIDALDPSQSCFPLGPTRAFNISRPFEIRYLSDHVLILFEWDHAVRRIYTDGRGHPYGYPDSFMGHSTGKWEGDTLVVDTVALRKETWIDGLGHPHTEDLHIVERLRRVKPDTLRIDFWFDDPKAYTKPWTGTKSFQLQQPGYDLMEHNICEDWLKMGTKRNAVE